MWGEGVKPSGLRTFASGTVVVRLTSARQHTLLPLANIQNLSFELTPDIVDALSLAKLPGSSDMGIIQTHMSN